MLIPYASNLVPAFAIESSMYKRHPNDPSPITPCMHNSLTTINNQPLLNAQVVVWRARSDLNNSWTGKDSGISHIARVV